MLKVQFAVKAAHDALVRTGVAKARAGEGFTALNIDAGDRGIGNSRHQ